MSIPDRLRMQAGNLLIGGLFEDGLDDLDLRETFARNLKFWLDRRKISGAELARRLPSNVGRSAVSHWLSGDGGTNFETLNEIARVLEIPAWYLIHEAGTAMPDGLGAPASAKLDEPQEALKVLAERLGYDIRLKPKQRT